MRRSDSGSGVAWPWGRAEFHPIAEGDVYKRQLVDRPGHRAGGDRIVIGLAADVLLGQQFLETRLFPRRLLDLGPVSYTHLDVYKRQELHPQRSESPARKKSGTQVAKSS